MDGHNEVQRAEPRFIGTTSRISSSLFGLFPGRVPVADERRLYPAMNPIGPHVKQCLYVRAVSLYLLQTVTLLTLRLVNKHCQWKRRTARVHRGSFQRKGADQGVDAERWSAAELASVGGFCFEAKGLTQLLEHTQAEIERGNIRAGDLGDAGA